VYFGGMTGRGRAVILKFNFSKSCNHKKSFVIGTSRSNVHHVNNFEGGIIMDKAANLLTETDVGLFDPVTGADHVDQGELWVSSKTRSCFYEDQWHHVVKTKDQGHLKEDGSKIYYDGRMDDVFKIHGKRLSIAQVEDQWTRAFGVPTWCVLSEEKRLLAFVKTTSEDNMRVLMTRAMTLLPPYLIPSRMASLSGGEPPMTTNGKIDKTFLFKNLAASSCCPKIDFDQSIEDLWQRFTGTHPNAAGSSSSFLTDGGDSYSAVLMAEALKVSSNDLLSVADITTILLTKSFVDLQIFCLKQQKKSGEKSAEIEIQNKRAKLEEGEKSAEIEIQNKRAKLEEGQGGLVPNPGGSSSTMILEFGWKHNMQKCIDASPLVVGTTAYIGSHKGLLAAFDLDDNAGGNDLYINLSFGLCTVCAVSISS
jgi:hypothetical protein